jgi:tRNA pseudouridine55 synthase
MAETRRRHTRRYGKRSAPSYNRGMPRRTRTFDGLLNLNKPAGISSARALDRVRGITRVRKSGHSGTLDPLATGVLVICMGRATKLVERLMNQPKVYRGVARLDVTSETLDGGSELQPVRQATPPTEGELAAALREFEGPIEQTPPPYSALKIKGRPAYKLARKNEPLELEARPVMVYWLCLARYSWPEVEFEMCCGRGTYVRSLVRDLGERLATGGCLTSLERRAIGPYHIDAAVTLDELAGIPLEVVAVDFDAAEQMLSRPVEIPAKPRS